MDWQYAVYYFVTALGTITGAVRYKKLSAGSRLFLIAIFLSALVEAVASYLATVFHNNLIISRTYPLVDYSLFALAFKTELPHYRKLIDSSIIVVVAVALIDTTVNYDFLWQQYPTVQKVVMSILIIGICLLFLYNLLHKESDYSFTEYPFFWLSLGWLFYSVINLFGFTAFNYIGIEAPQFAQLFYYLRFFGNLLLYSLFVAAFLTKQRRLTDS